MNSTVQRFSVWCAAPMIVLWMVGFFAFARFIPPPSPALDANQIAMIFAQNRNGIRIGLLITSFGAALLAPFFAVVTVQMKRIEGESSPLAYAQLGLSALFIVGFISPLYFLQAAAFREQRSPSDIQLLNDVTWLMFVGSVSIVCVQFALIGVAILTDKRGEPILPRWFGYQTLWSAMLFSAGGLCVFFQTGPFAWQGLVSWWMVLSVFAVWLGVATALLLRAVARQQIEEDARAAPGGSGADTTGHIERLTSDVAALRAELAELQRGQTTPGVLRSPVG